MKMGKRKLDASNDAERKRPTSRYNLCQYEGEDGCDTCASFNYENETERKYCARHKAPGMVNVFSKRCEYPSQPKCKIQPSFNFEGSKAKFCATHKEPGMVDVKSKRCAYTGCKQGPSFNYENESTTKFCGTHKEPGMIDVQSRKCERFGCLIRPVFNYANEAMGAFCVRHKADGMVDVVNKRCQHSDGCTSITPSFNFENESVGIFCAKHKLHGMVDVKSKRCEYSGCIHGPSFNYENVTPARFCAIHKEDGMVNVKCRLCEHDGCPKQSNYNFEGEETAKFCGEHKADGMINVRAKQCEHEGCNIQPSYNYDGETEMRFCWRHKDPEMVNVRDKHCENPGCDVLAVFNFEGECEFRFCYGHKLPGMVNIKSKRCDYSGCTTTQPIFGKPGSFPVHCAEHRQAGDISHPRRRCEIEDCGEFALFGMNAIPKFCEKHKASEHLNLVYKTCVVCSVLEHVDDEQKCTRCSLYMSKRMYCRKQRLVKFWIDADESIPKYVSYDHRIDSGVCGKERPDFVWDAGTHHVILEVDEYQHQSIACDCEQVRMSNVTSNLFGMPCLWIRFNPDDFKGEFESRTVKDSQRRDLLLRTIKAGLSAIPTSPSEFCRVQHLFFDGFNIGEKITTEVIPIL